MSFIVLRSGNENHRKKNGDAILSRSSIVAIKLCIDDDKDTGEFVAQFETNGGKYVVTFDSLESLKACLNENLGDLLTAHQLDDLVIRKNQSIRHKEQLEKALDSLKSALGA